jgi:CheY-like chemotaxis protein
MMAVNHEDWKSDDTVCRASRFTRMHDGIGSISYEQIAAAINLDLMNRGMKPVQPDYAAFEIYCGIDYPASARPLKVLVVDDGAESAFDTMARIAGWPGLEVEFYQYKPAIKTYGVSEADKQQEVARVRLDIVNCKPDVVLMDEGMPPIAGHDVVKELRTGYGRYANTGGDDGELRAAGAKSNFAKGRKAFDFARVIGEIE